MNNLRESFMSRDFIINSNIIKTISKLDINLDEFLLLVYFMNYSCELDSKDIESKLSFDEEKISNVFSSLLNKKYIELDVLTEGDKFKEIVKLEPLYDRLVLSQEKKEKHNDDIYGMFENEFSRTLSSIEYERINSWFESGISEEMIKDALKEAVLNNAMSFKYIEKILFNWKKNGKHIKEEKVDVFDYNWLDENE